MRRINLSGPFDMPKTKAGAVRQYDAIMRAARAAGRGGLTFGMDWPTFKINHPAAYAHIEAMRAVFNTLPERSE